MHQAADEQQDRRGEADGVVAGQEADGEGADRHHDHGEGEHALAADTVAERPEDEPAERPDQEGRGEGGEGGDHLGARLAGREEHLPQRARQIGVDPEVEPFHGVAERRRRYRAAHLRLVGDGDVLGAQRVFPTAQQDAEHTVRGGAAAAVLPLVPPEVRRARSSSFHIIPYGGGQGLDHHFAPLPSRPPGNRRRVFRTGRPSARGAGAVARRRARGPYGCSARHHATARAARSPARRRAGRARDHTPPSPHNRRSERCYR